MLRRVNLATPHLVRLLQSWHRGSDEGESHSRGQIENQIEDMSENQVEVRARKMMMSNLGMNRVASPVARSSAPYQPGTSTPNK